MSLRHISWFKVCWCTAINYMDPALHISHQSNILRQLYRSFLPHIKVNRNFLCVIILISPDFRGLGLKNLELEKRNWINVTPNLSLGLWYYRFKYSSSQHGIFAIRSRQNITSFQQAFLAIHSTSYPWTVHVSRGISRHLPTINHRHFFNCPQSFVS